MMEIQDTKIALDLINLLNILWRENPLGSLGILSGLLRRLGANDARCNRRVGERPGDR